MKRKLCHIFSFLDESNLFFLNKTDKSSKPFHFILSNTNDCQEKRFNEQRSDFLLCIKFQYLHSFGLWLTCCTEECREPRYQRVTREFPWFHRTYLDPMWVEDSSNTVREGWKMNVIRIPREYSLVKHSKLYFSVVNRRLWIVCFCINRIQQHKMNKLLNE